MSTKIKKKLIEEEKAASKQYKKIESAVSSAFKYVESLKKSEKTNSKDFFKINFC